MSKIEDISAAVAEAERFIKAAKKWQDELIDNTSGKNKYVSFQSKNASAAKRASMDLTRSLAVFRGRAQ